MWKVEPNLNLFSQQTVTDNSGTFPAKASDTKMVVISYKMPLKDSVDMGAILVFITYVCENQLQQLQTSFRPISQDGFVIKNDHHFVYK